MPTALLYLPTILFWLLILLLIVSELIGFFAVTVRGRFRMYAGLVILALGVWYLAETAHNLPMTLPDFTPWTHFMETTAAETPAPAAANPPEAEAKVPAAAPAPTTVPAPATSPPAHPAPAARPR